MKPPQVPATATATEGLPGSERWARDITTSSATDAGPGVSPAVGELCLAVYLAKNREKEREVCVC